VVEFSLSIKTSVRIGVTFTYQPEIPILNSVEDEVELSILRASAVRVADILPYIAETIDREIEIAVEKVVANVSSQLFEQTQKELREQGYLDRQH